MSEGVKKAARKPSPLMLRVEVREGRKCFVPADTYSGKIINERGYKVHDLVSAVLKKVNSTVLNKLLHYIGTLCVENIDDFAGLDDHRALKRLQIEGNIACDEIGVPAEVAMQLLREAVERGDNMVMMRIPRSMSFETMDEGERHEMGIAFCKHISARYWPALTPESIQEMAEGMDKLTD